MAEDEQFFSVLKMINLNPNCIFVTNDNHETAPKTIEATDITAEINKSVRDIVPDIKLGTDNEERNKSALFEKQAAGSKSVENLLSDDEVDLPYLPKEIYTELPLLLQKGCNVLDGDRVKDVFLTGSLGILSGCISDMHGTYDQKTVHANLNCFAVAPPASGKGVLIFSKALGIRYHNKLMLNKNEISKELAEPLNSKKSLPAEGVELTKPKILKRAMLFIPGNISAAALIQQLDECDGKGIMCETEADTISGSLKQDWGGFSDVIRKTFHHETISLSRKAKSEYVEIYRPRLSVVISGTPSQVSGLIKSVEDGLFSRFLFYAFNAKPEWKDVSPKPGELNLTNFYNDLSKEVLAFAEFIEKYPAEFSLTGEQYEKLDNYFRVKLKVLSALLGGEVQGTIKRLGLITFRISMILSAIRKYESNNPADKIFCEDVDFGIAQKLIDVYLQHAIYIMGTLPRGGNVKKMRTWKLFDNLPKHFNRKEAIEIGESLGIKIRTVDNYLSQLVIGGVLSTKATEFGYYEKV